MARKTITVTFTRETVAEATIEVPEDFDPISDTYEEVARDWLDIDENYERLEFDHDGCDIEIWNIEVPVDSDDVPIPVPAQVTLQRWQGDYAVEEGTREFDCATALDSIPLAELPEHADGFHDEGACDFGDDVFREAVRRRLVEDWDGPFEFYVADEDAYATYYDKRASEAGLAPVER